MTKLTPEDRFRCSYCNDKQGILCSNPKVKAMECRLIKNRRNCLDFTPGAKVVLGIDSETTLYELKQICNAMEKLHEVRGAIKALSSESYRKSLLKKYPHCVENLGSIISDELKPWHEDYEIQRDIIRNGIHTLKTLPDIPDLGEFLKTLESDSKRKKEK